MRQIIIYLLLCVFCISCRGPKIEYKNVDELISSIKQAEMYIKKIPAISGRTGEYVTFTFTEDNHFSIVGSTYNYNPIDTGTWEGYNNLQEMADTCRTFRGLTLDEWKDLKTQLLVLREMRVKDSNIAYYNDGVFQFFYYSCTVPGQFSFDPFCWAVLSDDIVKTEDFKSRFFIMDKKRNYIYYI